MEKPLETEILSAIEAHASLGLKKGANCLIDLNYNFSQRSSNELLVLLSDFENEFKHSNNGEIKNEWVFNDIQQLYQEKIWPDIIKFKKTSRFVCSKVYFDSEEYDKAAFTLSQNVSIDQLSPEEIFLWAYSLYLSGEKIKLQEVYQTSDQPEKDFRLAENLNIDLIYKKILTIDQKLDINEQPFILYMYSLMLKHKNQIDLALKYLIKAINIYPCFFSAWIELSELLSTEDEFFIVVPQLPLHWIKILFYATMAMKFHNFELAVFNWKILLTLLPNSLYIRCEVAVCFYFLQEFKYSQGIFKEILVEVPHHIKYLDYYSNILFVKELKPELSSLVHRVVKTHKYRPETCCIIANYCCSQQKIEQGILYFKRALKLDPLFLSAWILMGHEYIEIHNFHTAIDCYQQATEISPHDHRPWYSLGQAYEILSMHASAITYYERAAEIKKDSSDVWCSLANCYKEHDELDSAIKYYQIAAKFKDRHGKAVENLADIYRAIFEKFEKSFKENKLPEKYIKLVQSHPVIGKKEYCAETYREKFRCWAAYYYTKYIPFAEERGDGKSETIAAALLFLAQFYKKHDEPDTAKDLCERVMYINHTSYRMEAQNLLSKLVS